MNSLIYIKIDIWFKKKVKKRQSIPVKKFFKKISLKYKNMPKKLIKKYSINAAKHEEKLRLKQENN